MRIQIKGGNLEAIIPVGMNISRADEFVIKKKDWIKKNFSKPLKQQGCFYRGEKLEIKQNYDLFSKKIVVQLSGNNLVLTCPAGRDINTIKVYNTWLYSKAKEYIPERVKELAEKYRFFYNKLFIKKQRSRWGSCSSKKNVSFNYKLMRFRKEVIDYVIVHELCHLLQLNHSKNFWNLVEQILPNFKELRHELKTL